MSQQTPPHSSNSGFCPMAMAQKGCQWLEARLGLSSIVALGEKKKVPVHQHSIWYYMGGILMAILGVQLITGLLLMVYYIPELKSAHASILAINSEVEFGWFFRSFHSWGANLMVLALFAHLFSTYFLKSYRPPRELTWLTGIVLLVITLGFGFTGYLLPWDEVSYFATKIGLDITSKMPLVGEWMATMLRGGEDISQATLSRFFLIHIMVLPLALAGLLGVHLYLVQRHGMSIPPAKFLKKLCCAKSSDCDNETDLGANPEAHMKHEPFFPNFLLKDLMVWLLVLNLLAFLVALFPWGIGPEADPAAPAPLGIKPEWYFLAMFQFLKLLPAYIGPIEGEMAGMLFFAVIGLLLAVVPFFDKSEDSPLSGFFHWFGKIVCVGFVAFTIWGMVD